MGVMTASCGGSSQDPASSTTAQKSESSTTAQRGSGKITVRSTETLKSEDVTDGGVAGTGHFTMSGAIADAGTVTDYRTEKGKKILVRSVVAGKNGKITFLITIDTTAPPTALAKWTVTSATKSYEGLHGSGQQTVDDFQSSPATFALAGTVAR